MAVDARDKAETFFVVAAGRSGSTRLQHMLDQHPAVACIDEIDFIVELVTDEGGLPDLERFRTWLRRNRVFRARGLNLRGSSYQEMADSLFAQVRSKTGKRKVGAVCHYDFHRLLHLWPEAKFIHLVRDGRDVAYSCTEEMRWQANLWTGVEGWIQAQRCWERLGSEIPEERRLQITFEHLIESPESTLTRVCRFLGVEHDPSMTVTTEVSTSQTRYVGLWRHRLADRDVRVLEARIGDLLAQRGYRLSGLESLRVGRLRQAWFRAHNRCVRAWFEVRRFGLLHVLGEALARCLRLRAWQERLLDRRSRKRQAQVDRWITSQRAGVGRCDGEPSGSRSGGAGS